MKYAQLHEDGTFSADIPSLTPIVWDSNNFCTVEALVKDGKADQFHIVPITPTDPPEYDPVIELVERDGAVNVDGQWQYRWKVVPRYATVEEKTAAVLANLTSLKAAKNAEINAARLTANFSTFTHAGKAIACDQLSRSDIDGANGFVSLYGSLPPGWPGGWKAVDNTYTPITTVNDWKAFYASMFAAGNANFAHAQALKAALNNATTAEQVAAIQWGVQP